MSETRLMNILQSPHITEKTSQTTGAYRQYAFTVLPNANKFEIKKAVEQLLNVKVRSVQVCRVKNKNKTWKKAYVVLQENQEIDLTKSD